MANHFGISDLGNFPRASFAAQNRWMAQCSALVRALRKKVDRAGWIHVDSDGFVCSVIEENRLDQKQSVQLKIIFDLI